MSKVLKITCLAMTIAIAATAPNSALWAGSDDPAAAPDSASKPAPKPRRVYWPKRWTRSRQDRPGVDPAVKRTQATTNPQPRPRGVQTTRPGVSTEVQPPNAPPLTSSPAAGSSTSPTAPRPAAPGSSSSPLGANRAQRTPASAAPGASSTAPPPGSEAPLDLPPLPPPNSTTTATVAPPVATALGSTAAAGGLGAQSNVAGLGFNYVPLMMGDQPPFLMRAVVDPFTPHAPPAPTPGHPPIPPLPTEHGRNVTAVVPWARGFKIADNMSPRPMDRIFFTFDYFNNLGGQYNAHFGNNIRNQQVFQEMFGFEKTFWKGKASVGVRLPLNTLTADSPYSGIGGSSTALGNMTFFTKFVLWEDAKGDLVSTGAAITVPNGPSAFAGAPYAVGIRDVQLQKYIGYIYNWNKWFVQGFESIDVPTSSQDVTMLYSDVGLGYYLYKNTDPNSIITYIAPMFETHVNLPLNHVGAYRFNDPFGTPDVVDLTFATSVMFNRRAVLSIGFVNPVTGPRPFNFEWLVQFNWFFGRTARSPIVTTPPVVGS